jgi:glycosyltransferase involved in cell wall biosynthesis
MDQEGIFDHDFSNTKLIRTLQGLLLDCIGRPPQLGSRGGPGIDILLWPMLSRRDEWMSQMSTSIEVGPNGGDDGTSVCMATFNGEKYVARQLESILEQLAANDEVIVVDDCSTDGTVKAVERLNDPRIAVHINDRNRREVCSFSRAISLAQRRYIFLSDQDDVWLPGRVALIRKALQTALLATTNFEWIDQDERPLRVYCDGVLSRDSSRHFKNIADIFVGKTNYFGCAMAFRRALVPLIVPIPKYVESHDLWIALAANLIRSNVHLDEKTLRKRRHGNNATSTISARSLALKLRARTIFARSLLDLWKRSGRIDMPSASGAI